MNKYTKNCTPGKKYREIRKSIKTTREKMEQVLFEERIVKVVELVVLEVLHREVKLLVAASSSASVSLLSMLLSAAIASMMNCSPSTSPAMTSAFSSSASTVTSAQEQNVRPLPVLWVVRKVGLVPRILRGTLILSFPLLVALPDGDRVLGSLPGGRRRPLGTRPLLPFLTPY